MIVHGSGSTGRLGGVDADVVVCDDGAALSRDLELVGGKFEHRSEGGGFGNLDHLEMKGMGAAINGLESWSLIGWREVRVKR